MAKYNMKIHSIDNGFCRINYTLRTESGAIFHYCLQEEYLGVVVAYASTLDWEPSHLIDTEKVEFEIPTGNSTIEVIVRKYLQELYNK